MDPTVERLAQYIMQELGRGMPEQTLRANLMQHGWSSPWIDAAFQVVQRHWVQQQLAHPAAPLLPKKRRHTKVLAIIVALLIVLAIAAALLIPRFMRASHERTARDNTRRDDLAQLLSDLSDYYHDNTSYPTRAEINNAAFRKRQGFNDNALKDPQWSMADKACVKNGQAILSETIRPHCYAYKTSTSEGAPCDDKDTACTRMTLTMLFEKGNQATQVVFDRDNEVE